MTRLTSTCGTKKIGTQLSTSRQVCQGSTRHMVWHTMSDQQVRRNTLVIREVVQTCMHQHTSVKLLESKLYDPKPMTRLTSTCSTKKIGTQLSTSRQVCQGSTRHMVWHTMSDQQVRRNTLVIREVVQTCMHQHTSVKLLESELYDPKPMTRLTSTCGTKKIGTQLSTSRQVCQGSTHHMVFSLHFFCLVVHFVRTTGRPRNRTRNRTVNRTDQFIGTAGTDSGTECTKIAGLS